jgi:glycine/D-amino acid oxidase-like deaminating enzyme
MALKAGIVVIGGGVTGLSIAFHLAQRGVRDVVVVEKNFVASGATGKSSACIRQHYSTPETCRIVLKSLRFFEQFEELTGGRTASFVRTGYLLGVDDRIRRQMEASLALQQSAGINTRLITPDEIRELEPRLRTDDLVAGCYEPDSGYADPSQTAQGFAGAARDRGVRIMEQTEVVGILTRDDRIAGVRTSKGEIEAPIVVNAAGIWGDEIGRMAGLEIPITVCRHKINFVAWPQDALRPHPLVYDFVTNIYTRPETGGLILVGSLDSAEADDRVDPDAYHEGVTFDETLDALGRVAHRFPVLERGSVAKGYAGCFDVTPDWHPILDKVGPEGFYVAVGFSGHGFKLSPAVGEMMAELITEGPRPGSDVGAFRLSRFAEGKPIRGTYGDWLMC